MIEFTHKNLELNEFCQDHKASLYHWMIRVLAIFMTMAEDKFMS